MLSDQERLALAVAKKKELDYQLKEAEILLGLVKGHITEADKLIAELEFRIRVTSPPVKPKVGTPELDEEMKQVYSNGERSFAQVGLVLGLHEETVRKRLKELGVFVSIRFLTPEQKEGIISRYKLGETPVQIANSIGIHYGTIYRLLKSAGIKTQAISKSGRNPHKAKGRQNTRLRQLD